ncbi:MAG: hypothetical protein ACKVOQ_10870 [Cyclobacteriaceae bacterium]
MKKTLIYVMFFVFAGFASCTSKTESTATTTEESDEWKEMDSFHMIMAEAFHPFKDSSNLAPVKKLAEEMATEADKWASAELPAKVNKDEVKEELQKLKTDTRALADLIKSGADDAAIGSSLNSLHDSFHEIMEAWHGEGEKHEH